MSVIRVTSLSRRLDAIIPVDVLDVVRLVLLVIQTIVPSFLRVWIKNLSSSIIFEIG